MNYQAHSEISERIERAKEELSNCNLCPRNCGVNRCADEKGYCGLDDSVRCFREVLLSNEEAELVPSHQIYFPGCNLECAYCAVAEWNEEPLAAEKVDFEALAEKVAQRRREGAKTVNLLGGEPTVNLHGILELLSRVEVETKIVWNSNMYYNDVVDRLTRGLVDVYLADFKCGNDDCAEKILGAKDYVGTVKRNILKAGTHSDLIVRHLILPGHIECCLKPILEWLAAEIPEVKLSFWDDYMPPARVSSAPTEYLTKQELGTAIEMAKGMGLNLIQ